MHDLHIHDVSGKILFIIKIFLKLNLKKTKLGRLKVLMMYAILQQAPNQTLYIHMNGVKCDNTFTI